MTNDRMHPVAKATLGYANGHWWNHFERAEPPDSYQYQDEEVRGLEAVRPEHRPDVPEEVDWSKYVAYKCRNRYCQDDCLNRADSLYAQHKLCRACYPGYNLENKSSNTRHLPEWARGLDVDHTTATSEGEGESARPEAQPERSSSRQPAQRSEQAAPTSEASGEHPGPDRERQSRSAPTRQAGSAPLRGDPEARAHTPNPQGEGSPEHEAHQPESDVTANRRSP